MAMHPCSSCRRHVLASSSVCPFCAAPQRDTSSQLGFAGILLGLALAGCGDDGTDPTTTAAEASMSASMTTDPTDTDATSSTGGGNTTAAMTETAEASDYGGPEVTSDFDTTDTPEESSSGDDTTGTDSSGGSDSTGTDTGSATTDTGTAEGADYGAAPPRD
jgi:hypothetical protein